MHDIKAFETSLDNTVNEITLIFGLVALRTDQLTAID